MGATERTAPATFGLPALRLPFVVLPPGKCPLDRAAEHYRQLALGSGYVRGRRVDYARIEAIRALRPAGCWVGEKAWSGYIVYEFAEYDRVILDCPLDGNAAFVLTGNWRAMVRISKAEIRDEFAKLCIKVVHKGDWPGRLQAALQNRQYGCSAAGLRGLGAVRGPTAAPGSLYRSPAEAAAARARRRGTPHR
jgi:hypothetical protein